MAQESRKGAGPHYVLTPGKLMAGPAIFENGLPGNPSAPRERGDAKAVGSANYPMSAKNPKNTGPLKAFGLKGSGGVGGKGGLGD